MLKTLLEKVKQHLRTKAIKSLQTEVNRLLHKAATLMVMLEKYDETKVKQLQDTRDAYIYPAILDLAALQFNKENTHGTPKS